MVNAKDFAMGTQPRVKGLGTYYATLEKVSH